MENFNRKIVILEMANNHMGDVEHGTHMIEEFGKIIKKHEDIEFVFKLQFRNLETFIRSDYKNRLDLKFIKRFSETRLEIEDFAKLIEVMKDKGFKTMATPFDNDSVPLFETLDLDYVKVASASFGDWPLLEAMVKLDKPIVASTAGAPTEVIDEVVSFFRHREKDFMLMHCVGEYPTKPEAIHLSQIDFLKNRYQDIEIGLSTHEEPDNYDLVKMAVAKNTKVFEKHVGLPTEQYPLNAYSASPEQFEKWLASMEEAYKICGQGQERMLTNEQERRTLRDLRRGVFAKKDIAEGEALNYENVYFAFPPDEGQLTANEFSKYITYKAKAPIKKDAPIIADRLAVDNKKKKVREIVEKVHYLLKESGVVVPNECELEISHHYGLEKFYEYGSAMITVVNRNYCKKIIMLLPGQQHPEQFHKIKEETFHLLYGDLKLSVDGETKICQIGDVNVIKPYQKHSFSTEKGAVIEEISSAHLDGDSFYTDQVIMENPSRKTIVRFWVDL